MSERERDKSVFYVASVPGLSGFRDNETGHARANVVTPPPTLVNLVTIGSLATHQTLAQLASRILRYEDGGARAHMQRYPTPPMTCGKHLRLKHSSLAFKSRLAPPIGIHGVFLALISPPRLASPLGDRSRPSLPNRRRIAGSLGFRGGSAARRDLQAEELNIFQLFSSIAGEMAAK